MTIGQSPSGKQIHEPEIAVASPAVLIEDAPLNGTNPPIASSTPLDYYDSPSANNAAALIPERTVEVIAPTNMTGGYQFYVTAGNGTNVSTSMKVEVPPEGVHQGQRFHARVIDETSTANNPHKIPNGDWRDGLCDCCRFGCCHPQFCLTCWCSACALGQILSRLKLNWCAYPQPTRPATSTFAVFVLLTTAYYLASQCADTAIRVGYDEEEDEDDAPTWVMALMGVRFLVNVSFWLLCLIVTIRTRGYIRRKYSIPEKHCCQGAEDCCCSFWCAPCTICQMARHTADYDTYRAGCCTEDGLSRGSPEVV